MLPNDLAACHAIIREQARTAAAREGKSQAVIKRQHDKIEDQKIEIAKLEKERDAALQLAFRKKIERYPADPKQFVLDFGDSPEVVDAAEGIADAAVETVAAYERRKPAAEKPRSEQLPAHLPRYEVKLDVPEEEKTCKTHGEKELLVVIAIIGTLVGLLLPAVQAARESARKSACSNNVKQLALGALNYESGNGRYPTSGQGEVKGVNYMNVESFFVQILSFVEQAGIAGKWNPKKPYWDANNMPLAATRIPGFLCPSNGIGKDDYGGTVTTLPASGYRFYGQTDYMPAAYTDLSPTDGQRVRQTTSSDGAYKMGILSYDQSTKSSSCRDGTTNTVIFFEDSARDRFTTGTRDAASGGNAKWGFAVGGKWTDVTTTSSADMPGGKTCPNRWADSDNASGISGPPHEQTTVPRTQPLINNTKTPLGGSSATCTWDQNNCGPNDEPFSLHSGNGCYAGFADGSVHWLSEKLDVQVLRQLTDPADAEQPLPYE